MKKKLVAVGVLAGGIALTGLAGSAYAEGGKATAKPTVPKGKGVIAIACVGKGEHIKGKPEKGIVSIKPGKFPPPRKAVKVRADGKALPAPPPGAKVTKGARGAVKIAAKVGGPNTVKLGPLPKGVHCTVVKPGTPGVPPVPPAR